MTSWNDLKLFSKEELMELVPKGFKFKTEPWEHQIATFIANIANPGMLDSLDLGTGKTKVSIDTARYIDLVKYNNKKKVKVLFICLNSAVEKMRDEVLKHSDLRVLCIRGSKKEKWKLFERKRNNFYIINYEGLRSILSMRVLAGVREVYNKKTDKFTTKAKNKEVIDPKMLKRFSDFHFDHLVLDESHTIKSSKSLIFRMIKKLCVRYKARNLLTGTLFGNTLLDVWPQYFVVDFGETYGSSFNRFRDSYFVDKGYFGPLWVPTPKGKEIIKSKLYNKAIRYREDECNDLPPKVFRVLKYNLSREQRKLYDLLKEDKATELTKEIANKGIGFRTICSGFIKSADHIFKDNPKLDILWDTIENVIEQHKIVIFVEYTLSRKIIEAHLKKKKVMFTSLSGESKDKYAPHHIFQTNPECRVIVCQIKSGGASIDLFAGTYCIFYEHGGSVINYKQALKRIHRGGQTEKCFFYSLLGMNTVEISIHRDLISGVDAFSNIVDNESARRYIEGE